jgi:hypothetical protein
VVTELRAELAPQARDKLGRLMAALLPLYPDSVEFLAPLQAAFVRASYVISAGYFEILTRLLANVGGDESSGRRVWFLRVIVSRLPANVCVCVCVCVCLCVCVCVCCCTRTKPGLGFANTALHSGQLA